MKLKKILVVAICFLITSTMVAFAAPSVGTLQRQIDSLKKQIASLIAQNSKLKSQAVKTSGVKYVINGIEKSNNYKPGTIVYNGTLYAPVQFISSNLDKKMTWDNAKNTVYISDTGAAVNPLKEVPLYNKPYIDTNAQKCIRIDADKKCLKLELYSNDWERDENDILRHKYYLVYPVNGKAASLLGSIFVTDDDRGEIVVKVYDDSNNILYNSGTIKKGMDKVDINANIKNSLKVKIEVECSASTYFNYYAVLENLRVLTTDY